MCIRDRPNLVSKEWSNAQVALNNKGLKHQLVESESSQTAAVVTYQYPHAGAEVASGTTIYPVSYTHLVKNKFRRWSTACTCPPEFPVCVCGGKAKAKLITRKPIEADQQELEENRRSRSAHLRVLEKL